MQKNISKPLKIPSRLGRLLESYICFVTGKNEIDEKILVKIRQSVISQKSGYWNVKPVGKYGRAYDVFAYLAYQAPGYIIQFRYILTKLEELNILPDNIKILDLGTGPGIVPLASVWYQKERKKGSLTINVIEQSEEFLKAFQYLVPAFISNSPDISLEKIYRSDIQDTPENLPEKITLITFQNVLTEMSSLSVYEQAELVLRYALNLSEDGFIIIIEPAEFRHSTKLRELQTILIKNGFYVRSPCKYIRKEICNPDKCWTFCSLPKIEPPHLMQLLAGEKDAYRFLNTDIKFSYLICSKKDYLKESDYNIPKNTIPLSNLEKGQEGYVNVVASKMSSDIGNQDYAVYYICDATGTKKTYLVIPRSLHNDAIIPAFSAEYGEILGIYNVRVRWNKKKDAYNLITGDSSKIFRMKNINKPEVSKKKERKENIKNRKKPHVP